MRNFLKIDWVIFFVVSLLTGIGFLSLYSISFVEGSLKLEHFERQVVSLAIGAAAMFLVAFFYDYRVLNSYSSKLYFIILAILAAVAMWGQQIRGTAGWIGIAGFHIQPVEITKLVMIIFLASFLSKKQTKLSTFGRTIVSTVLAAIPVFLILKQPDFGSASIVIGIWFVMLMVSGIGKKNLFIVILIGLVGLSAGWFLLKDYQKERLITFVNPENDPRGSGYNVIQSMVAVGSGGFLGKGLGHGSQSQLNFLPEKHTDFIFAVIAEEMGLVGAMVVFVLFGTLFYRIKEAARLARDNFGYLLSVGVMAMLFLQILVNVGMNIGLVPVAGVPLPFLSYGGSSLVVVLVSIGLVQSIYARRIKTLD